MKPTVVYRCKAQVVYVRNVYGGETEYGTLIFAVSLGTDR
jgi:hypothetical protein